jgi:hypothetical protein
VQPRAAQARLVASEIGQAESTRTFEKKSAEPRNSIASWPMINTEATNHDRPAAISGKEKTPRLETDQS